MNTHKSWSQESLDFLDVCIKKHGHADFWKSEKSLILNIVSLKGLIPLSKGLERYFTDSVDVVINPRKQTVEFSSLQGALKANYDSGNVFVQMNEATLKYPNHFKKLSSKNKLKRWQIQDGVYFFGQALVTYYSVPSILSELRLINFKQTDQLKSFQVEFPTDFPTHSQRQTFHFDNSGLLIRHDYTADVIGAFATGSHFTSEYLKKEGIQVAGKREVMLRIGPLATKIPVLIARLK